MSIGSNLHQPLWKPTNYQNVHREASTLTNMIVRESFHSISPKGITKYLSRGSDTKIEFTLENPSAAKIVISTHVQLNSHSSNNQPLIKNVGLKFGQKITPEKKLVIKIESLDQEDSEKDIKACLENLPLLEENTTSGDM
ncbi:hypothetical protein O181_026155 [Austropuccinia psidii MF-1]|uniref:Uncharacterized protein n=1 Tax=Austropuccinia psidii MF-1 TaxID=1389203 RepID=A0A9Q3CNU8_9BASI|nr:hypothetical protein [Austropuccinia psidii MF-1]